MVPGENGWYFAGSRSYKCYNARLLSVDVCIKGPERSFHVFQGRVRVVTFHCSLFHAILKANRSLLHVFARPVSLRGCILGLEFVRFCKEAMFPDREEPEALLPTQVVKIAPHDQ